MIFYLWLLTSVVILGRRYFLRLTTRDPEELSSTDDTQPPAPKKGATERTTGTVSGRSATSSASSGSRLRPGRPAGPDERRGTGRDALGAPGAAGEGGLVDAIIREELARKKREEGEDATGRAGLFAPLSPPSSTEDHDEPDKPDKPDKPDRLTVGEALQGITLPCDLVPMILDADHPDPHHAAFATVGFEAHVVGAKLGDELERLGYEISSSSATTAVARRDDVMVTVEIHAAASEARADGERLFPTAPGGSVVVEITT